MVNLVSGPLTYRLFGQDAFPDGDMTFIQPSINDWVENLLVNTWHRYRKALGRERLNIEKKKIETEKEWKRESCI